MNELNKNEIMEIIKNNPNVIVMVKAIWCGECMMTAPIFDRIAQNPEFSNVKFAKIDVDTAELWADDNDEFFKVTEVPTILFYNKGVESDRFTNFAPEAKIVAFIKKNVK